MIKNFTHYIKFGMVGLFNTILSYSVYSLLVYMGVYYIAASVVAFVISVLSSFLLNGRYVFKKDAGEKRDIVRSLVKVYSSYALTGLVVYNVLLFIWVDVLEVSKYIAPFFSLPITVPLNYILNRFWVFKGEKK